MFSDIRCAMRFLARQRAFTLVAAAIPARRATRVDPMMALRSE